MTHRLHTHTSNSSKHNTDVRKPKCKLTMGREEERRRESSERGMMSDNNKHTYIHTPTPDYIQIPKDEWIAGVFINGGGREERWCMRKDGRVLAG